MTVARRPKASGTSLPPHPSTLWKALAGYPMVFGVLFLAQQPHRRPARRAAQRALKLVSATHATLTTVLAGRDLLDCKWQTSNLITTRSADSNAVVGLEAGYLLQDTVISALLHSRWSPALLFDSKSPRIPFETLMVTHHITLAPLLLLFLQFVKHGRERGVFFVEAFLLMNASTPLLNLRWWLADLAKHRPALKTELLRASAVNDGALVVTFFACRIGLIFYMLHLYGKRTGRSIVGSFLSIPMQCKTGTSAILVLNTLWWLSLVQRTLRRNRQNGI